MRVLLIVYFILFLNFNFFSQKDTIVIIHNEYSFQVSISTIIKHFQIDDDSTDFYKNGLSELILKNPEISSDSTLVYGSLVIDFSCILDIFNENQSSIKIIRNNDKQLVKYKVKYFKVKDRTNGIGGSSKTYLIIIDKKKRIEIVHEIIQRNLAC